KDYSGAEMQEWWGRLSREDHQLALDRAGSRLPAGSDWDDLPERVQDAMLDVRERWDAEDAATAKAQHNLPLEQPTAPELQRPGAAPILGGGPEQEAPNGLQGPVRPRDEGTGAADVQRPGAVGWDGRPPTAQEPRGAPDAGGTAGERPEG